MEHIDYEVAYIFHYRVSILKQLPEELEMSSDMESAVDHLGKDMPHALVLITIYLYILVHTKTTNLYVLKLNFPSQFSLNIHKIFICLINIYLSGNVKLIGCIF